MARLIESTPIRPLKELIAALNTPSGPSASDGIFSVFRATVACDKPMMLRSNAVFARLQPAVQWLTDKITGGGVPALHDCSRGIVSIHQMISRVPETHVASW